MQVDTDRQRCRELALRDRERGCIQVLGTHVDNIIIFCTHEQYKWFQGELGNIFKAMFPGQCDTLLCANIIEHPDNPQFRRINKVRSSLWNRCIGSPEPYFM